MPKGLPVVQRLLADLDIETLVIVDDEEEAKTIPAVEDVIGGVRSILAGAPDSLERKRLDASFAELGLSASAWDEQLRRRWDGGDGAARTALATTLVPAPNDSADQIKVDMGTIASWFGEAGPKFVLLTPERWEAEGKALLDGLKGSVICLFDEDLQTGRKGTALIEAALAEKREEHRFFFGLLTATVSLAGEDAATESVQRKVSNDRVIVISKDYEDDPARFANRLRILVLATYHTGLRDMAKEAIEAAFKETQRRLDDLTVGDFDRIVVETAQREGTWEADELLRLIGIWERSERRASILADREKFERLLVRMRGARRTAGALDPASPLVRELRRLELYAADDINRAYLPIELGDVFSRGSQEYVLLIQPCDMAVRKEGERNRSPRFAPLAAIVRTGGEDPDDAADAFYHLEYYEPNAEKQAFIHFRKVALLPLSVLDLVSFRPDGQTAIDLSSEAPAEAFAAMRKRHRDIVKELKLLLADLAAAERLAAEAGAEGAERENEPERDPGIGARPAARRAKVKEPERLDLAAEAARLERLAWAPFQGDAGFRLEPARSGSELSFGLRRVGRILPPHATIALTRFHQFSSRPAFEADFASG